VIDVDKEEYGNNASIPILPILNQSVNQLINTKLFCFLADRHRQRDRKRVDV